jgi:hypothetical protein
MKINKFKAISIIICCSIASLWSGAQSMDYQPDNLESATINRTANILSSSQNEFDNEIDALDLVSTSSQIINLEDSKASWASYLTSPVKATFQTANEFMNLAMHSPKLAMVVGMVYLIPAVSAYCNCYCYDLDPTICRFYMMEANKEWCAWQCECNAFAHYCRCDPIDANAVMIENYLGHSLEESLHRLGQC